MVVVDPPFITHAVWESYAITVNLLLKSGTNADGSPKGKIILTTLQENADHLYSILKAKPTVSNAISNKTSYIDVISFAGKVPCSFQHVLIYSNRKRNIQDRSSRFLHFSL